MKTNYLLAAFAATLLATGCFQDVHEIDPSKNVGYVVPELNWKNPSLAGTDIHDLLVVVDGQGEAYTKHYTNVRDIAREPLEVPVGESEILVLANASEADGYQISGLPATKFTMMEAMLCIGKDIPAQNCYAAISPVKMISGVIKKPLLPLCPVFPTLEMIMSNIPQDLKVLAVQGDVAAGVRLVEQDGRFGVGSTEQIDDRVLGLVDGTPCTVLTHPTVSGKVECSITFEVFEPDPAVKNNMVAKPRQGIVDYALILTYVVKLDVPLVCGTNYKIEMDFNSMYPEMHLSSYSISDWEIGFTYEGRAY